MVTPASIIVGAPATVKIGAYGAGIGAAVDLGSTDGGLKLMYNPEFFNVKTDQTLSVLKVVKIGEDMKVEVTLSECSLVNLVKVLGYPSTALSSVTAQIGGNPVVTDYEMFITGNGPSSGTRLVTIKKCAVIGAVELPMTRDGKSLIKLTVQVLQDTTKTANQQLISVVDSGTDTTAPTVAMTTPADGGTVSKSTKDPVTLTFTETDNVMDESSIVYGESVIVSDIENPLVSSVVAGALVYNSVLKTLTFTPSSNWAAGAANNYQITINTAVRDSAGNKLAAVFYGHFVTV